MNSEKIKNLLIPYYVGHKKIRLGNRHDGGYVFSEDLLENTNVAYSLGIGNDCSLDIDLANRNYKVFMYDCRLDQPPKTHENFIYKKCFVDSKVLQKEILDNNHDKENILLAMDVEGSEYEIFANMQEKFLVNFSQISFEIHDVLKNPNVIPLLDKLNYYFVLIHIHANNYTKPKEGLADALELTYVNKKFVKSYEIDNNPCPVVGLDFPNNPNRPDIKLNWWCNFEPQ
jgi:hypothetical protein